MRTLNAQELTAVAGGQKAAANPATRLNAILAALAAKGVTFALDGTNLTITTPKGSKTVTLPADLAAKLAAMTAPAPAAA
ncbi:MAG: hypothetical protein RI907_2067 [Pseudomonadota bacterium]|jgi:hypothetical protein